MVFRRDSLVPRPERVDVNKRKSFSLPVHADKDFTRRIRDLAGPDENKAGFSAAFFLTGAVGGCREHAVLDGTRDHGIRAIGQHQVGWMAEYVRAGKRQGSGSLRKNPVATNHQPHNCSPQIKNRKTAGPCGKPQFLIPEQVYFPVCADPALWTEKHSRVKAGIAASLRHAEDDMETSVVADAGQGLGSSASRNSLA